MGVDVTATQLHRRAASLRIANNNGHFFYP